MTRDGKRPLTAFIAVLILAVSLSACGGSGSEDSTGSTDSTTSATTAKQDAGKAGGEGSSGGDSQSQEERRGGAGQEDEGDGSGSGNVATPLEVSGGGSAQFRVKGGDNSIQEYGDEGDESELQEVAEIVHAFYVARAEEQWDTACSYLAKTNVEQLEQLAAQSPQFKDAGCGPILKAFTRPLPASVQREITTVDAGSFRREGEQGFLIYTGAEETTYAMPLRNEDGTWKLSALSASALG